MRVVLRVRSETGGKETAAEKEQRAEERAGLPGGTGQEAERHHQGKNSSWAQHLDLQNVDCVTPGDWAHVWVAVVTAHFLSPDV